MVMESFTLCYCCKFSLGMPCSCCLLEGSAGLEISNLGRPRDVVSLDSLCLWGTELPCCFLQGSSPLGSIAAADGMGPGFLQQEKTCSLLEN